MSSWTRRKTLTAGLFALGAAFVPREVLAQFGGGAERMVASWYRQYLGRGMDPGARQWVNMLRRGEDPLFVQSGILASQEYWERAGQDPGRFVDNLFRDVVGQRPTRRDFNYWAGRFSWGENRQDVVLDFLSQYAR
jgi:hypothetical protein